jgi:Uma2 family endonuclease
MSEKIVPPPGRMTAAEFLPWAETQEAGRFELSGGEVIAMSPERGAHTRVKYATWLALRGAIRAAGLPCDALGDGPAVRIDDDTVYEPDVLVTCGARMGANDILAPPPLVIVEVTSPSNSRVDLTTKLADYFRIGALRHYIVVVTARRLVIHHRRGEDGAILTRMLPSGPLTLDPPGITVAVESFFEE